MTTLTLGSTEIRDFGGANTLAYYPHPDARQVGGVKSFLHRDHLASVRLVADAAGVRARFSTYQPYGVAADTDFAAATAPENNGFIGERYDEDAGLQYLNARYYDPALGRFIQPDWWDPLMPGVGTNRYTYSRNDLVDPLTCRQLCFYNRGRLQVSLEEPN